MFSDNIKVSAAADSAIPSISEKFLAPYRQKLQDSFETKIGTAADDFIKTKPGGSLGNLLTEAVWQYIQSQDALQKDNDSAIIFLTNYGGMRLSKIEKGPITVRKIYELLPFENTLVKMIVPGHIVAEIIKKQNANGGWPMRCTNNQAFRSLKQLQQQKSVILYTNNYLAEGGDNCNDLLQYDRTDLQILLRDILCDYIKKQDIIQPDTSSYLLR